MNVNFIDRLRADFPLMYEDGADVWCDKGWEPIIYHLSSTIQHYIDRSNSRRQWLIDNKFKDIPEPIEQVKVAQVKEKYGGLRFYYDYGDEFIAGLVEMAEIWAERTCEVCGEKGSLRGDLPWIRTLCDEHYEQSKVKPVSVGI
jgi:hypothetical protein